MPISTKTTKSPSKVFHRIKRYTIDLWVLGLLFHPLTFSHALARNPNNCSHKDRLQIKAAIKSYLNNSGASVISAHDSSIHVMQCAENYAKATIKSKKALTDEATVFLRKDNTNWQVMSLGTDFETDFLNKLPTELRN